MKFFKLSQRKSTLFSLVGLTFLIIVFTCAGDQEGHDHPFSTARKNIEEYIYKIGWSTSKYFGYTIVQHSGHVIGAKADLKLLSLERGEERYGWTIFPLSRLEETTVLQLELQVTGR